MAVIAVTVTGMEPGLLMCSPQGMLQASEGQPVGPRRQDQSPQEAAESLAYRLPDGSLGFPAVAFQRATMEGGRGQLTKIAGKGRPVSVQTVLAGLWEVEPKGLIPLLRGGKPIREYTLDVRTGLNSNTRPPARIVLVRPLVEAPWDAEFEIIWDDVGGSENTPALIRLCMERAGRQVGVGGFRPLVQGKATGGWFGRFSITRWEPA